MVWIIYRFCVCVFGWLYILYSTRLQYSYQFIAFILFYIIFSDIKSIQLIFDATMFSLKIMWVSKYEPTVAYCIRFFILMLTQLIFSALTSSISGTIGSLTCSRQNIETQPCDNSSTNNPWTSESFQTTLGQPTNKQTSAGDNSGIHQTSPKPANATCSKANSTLSTTDTVSVLKSVSSASDKKTNDISSGKCSYECILQFYISDDKNRLEMLKQLTCAGTTVY